MAGLDRTWQGMAGLDRTWQGMAGHDMASQGMLGVAHMAGSYHSYESSFGTDRSSDGEMVKIFFFLKCERTVVTFPILHIFQLAQL